MTRNIDPAARQLMPSAHGGGRMRPPIRKAGWALSPAWHQPVFMAILLTVTEILAVIGLGAVGRLVFLAAGAGAAVFYMRRSPWEYITITFWFWTLAPFARRIIDLQAGFDPVNFLLGTPNLMALFMVKDIITSRELLRLREVIVGLFVLIPILYGLGISLVQGDIVPGISAAADWLAPPLYYFYFVINWRRIDEADQIYRDFLTANALMLVVYCIYQFVSPPPWDVFWIVSSGLTFGTPVPFGLRIFGTLNSPGLMAIWLGMVILLLLHFRTKLSPVLLPLCLVLLLMSLSRSVEGGVVLGFLVAGLLGRKGIFKLLGIAVVLTTLVLAGVAAVVPDLADQMTIRFTSVGDLNTDTSAIERTALYAAAPRWISEHPLGMGIGALGRGAVAGQNQDLVVVDSGPISIYLSLGWVFGSVYIGGIGLVLAQAILAARATRSQAAIALAAAAVSAASVIVFFNVTGLAGVTLWTCAAYASTLGIAARERPRPTAKTARSGIGYAPEVMMQRPRLTSAP